MKPDKDDNSHDIANDTEYGMTEIRRIQMEEIFDEWARQYAASPEEFEKGPLDENGNPVENYGKGCVENFERIENELRKAGKLPFP